MTIHFRKSTIDDVEELFRIWSTSVQATHDFLLKEDYDLISTMVKNDYLPHALLWVGVDESQAIVGFMGMTQNHIDALFIAPELRGKGLGKQFIKYAQELVGLPLGVDVNEQNKQAAGFYEKMGFEIVSRSPLDDQGRPYPLLHMTKHI